MFEAQLSSTRLRRSKTKEDLDDSEWTSTINSLLQLVSEADDSPLKNVALRARLDSSEEYDQAGALVGDELAEEQPSLRLLVSTSDVLAITYGSIEMTWIDVEELTSAQRDNVNLLSWLSIATEQEQHHVGKIAELQAKVSELTAVANSKEAEIQEMTEDYKMIIHDLEDRFFQVLNSKRKRIAELEQDESEDLSELNHVFLKRNENNLDRVHVEDIIIGNEYQNYAETKKQARAKRETKRRTEIIKEETDELGASQPKRLKKEVLSPEVAQNSDDSNHVEAKREVNTTEKEKISSDVDVTDYSESDNDENSHTADEVVSVESLDENSEAEKNNVDLDQSGESSGNETEYSE